MLCSDWLAFGRGDRIEISIECIARCFDTAQFCILIPWPLPTHWLENVCVCVCEFLRLILFRWIKFLILRFWSTYWTTDSINILIIN